MDTISKFNYEESLTESNSRYTPTTIRIVKLLPRPAYSEVDLSTSSCSSPRIETQLQLVDLQDLGSMNDFSALSYTGKLEDPKQIILVNGSPYSIGANLYSALCQLQPSFPTCRPRNIWIDALCINQDDAHEKCHQDSLGGQIYASARCGISWLGPEADGSSLALKHLEMLGRVYPQVIESREKHIRGASAIVKTVGFDCDTWLPGIIHLFKRDYWQRTWIHQEAVLSKLLLVLCGSEALAFERFIPGVMVVLSILIECYETPTARDSLRYEISSIQPILALSSCHAIFVSSLYSTVSRIKTQSSGTSSLVSLKDIVNHLCLQSQFIGTEPRNRILSLFDLFSDSARYTIPFDHHTTEMQLYVRLTEALIRVCWNESTNPFRILKYAGSHRKMLLQNFYHCHPSGPGNGRRRASEESSESSLGASLPSWVLDWGWSSPHTLGGVFNTDIFNASLNISTANIPISLAETLISTNILRVPIVHFDDLFEVDMYINDTVLSIIPSSNFHYDFGTSFFRREIASGSRQLTVSNDTSRPLFNENLPYGAPRTLSHDNAIAHTIVAGASILNSFAIPRNDNVEERSGATEEAMFRILWQPTLAKIDADLKNRYLEFLCGVARGRRPALTVRGRIGMVPDSAQPGDMLVVILGAPRPFVVRPVRGESNKTQRHILIGECYIHGVMDGEIVKEGLDNMSFIELE